MLHKKIRTELLFLFIAIAFYGFDFYLRISPSLIANELMLQYSTSATGMSLVTAMFYLGYTLAQIPGGFILDNYKLKTVNILTILICIIAFTGAITTTSLYFAAIFRFLVGAGSAISFVCVLYIAKNYFRRELFTLISGITISLGTLSASSIQGVVAYLIDSENWQKVYIYSAQIGLLLVLALILIPASFERHKSSIKLPTNYISIVKSLLTIDIFYCGLVGGLFYMPTSVLAALWGVHLLELVHNIELTKASFAIVLLFLGWAVGSPVLGYLVTDLKKARLILISTPLLATFVLSVLLYTTFSGVYVIYILVFLFGLFSSGQVCIWSIFSHRHGDANIGMAIALLNMLIIFVVACGQFTVGLLIDLHHGNLFYIKDINYSMSDYVFALSILLCGLVSISFLTWSYFKNDFR